MLFFKTICFRFVSADKTESLLLNTFDTEDFFC